MRCSCSERSLAHGSSAGLGSPPSFALRLVLHHKRDRSRLDSTELQAATVSCRIQPPSVQQRRLGLGIPVRPASLSVSVTQMIYLPSQRSCMLCSLSPQTVLAVISNQTHQVLGRHLQPRSPPCDWWTRHYCMRYQLHCRQASAVMHWRVMKLVCCGTWT
jgi:hypothetical protein